MDTWEQERHGWRERVRDDVIATPSIAGGKQSRSRNEIEFVYKSSKAKFVSKNTQNGMFNGLPHNH